MGNAEGTLGELSTDREKGEVYEDWLMAPGDLGGINVTVFSASHPPSSRKRPYIERALQASKVYRHPGLLKYLDGGMLGGEVVIVSESATPLYKHDLKLMPALQITAGLSAIMDTLIFLHDRAGVSHNNVNPCAIFVTSEGLWKLWALNYSCSFGELSRDHIEHINNYCSDFAIPPDDKTTISPSYQHARDCYAFAKLVDTVLTPHITDDLPFAADFLSVVKTNAMNKQWSKRLRLATLADHNFFRHDFLQLHHDLRNVLLLPEQQRETFLMSLASNLQQYPEELVASTMSGSLLSHTLLLIPAAATHLMPAVLTPKSKQEGRPSGLFSEELYKRYIIPPLLQLFTVLDVTVRIILITHLSSYISLISLDVLRKQVLPEILLGIRDTNDVLVEATLHGLAHFVPILGGDVVIGSNRHHLFTTAKPKAVSSKASSIDHNTSLHNKRDKTHTKVEDVWSTNQVASTTSSSSSVFNDDLETNSLDNLNLDNLSISQIPERSSPDGGEDDEAIIISGKLSISNKEEDIDAWSDWEELHEPQSYPTKVKPTASEIGITSTVTQNLPELIAITEMAKNNTSNELNKNDMVTGDMKSLTSQGFGEEYDIMAIKVKKRHDTELDLFADIEPKFETKKFDLESLLEDANVKNDRANKERLPSVSATLACLDTEVIEEGEGWDEDNWGDQELNWAKDGETSMNAEKHETDLKLECE